MASMRTIVFPSIHSPRHLRPPTTTTPLQDYQLRLGSSPLTARPTRSPNMTRPPIAPKTSRSHEASPLNIRPIVHSKTLDRYQQKIKAMETELNQLRNLCAQNTPLSFEKSSVKRFTYIATIGQGHWGPIQLCRGDEHKLFVCKIIEKTELRNEKQRQHVIKEVQVMRQLNHPFIGRMYGTYKTDAHICIILESLLSGDFFTYLNCKNNITQTDTIFFIQCITIAITYLHENNIIHRDLKPENIMICDDGYVKLIDFGYANMCYENKMRSWLGTPEYIAPEITNFEYYGIAVDWWSVGIIMYECIEGNTPFNDTDNMALFEKIRTEEPVFVHCSDANQRIIKGLLEKDPKKRLNGVTINDTTLFRNTKRMDLLQKKISAPHIPNRKHSTDISNFEKFNNVEWTLMEDRPYKGDPTEWDYYI